MSEPRASLGPRSSTSLTGIACWGLLAALRGRSEPVLLQVCREQQLYSREWRRRKRMVPATERVGSDSPAGTAAHSRHCPVSPGL